MVRQRPKTPVPRITGEGISAKIQDIPGYLAFLERQQTLQRLVVKIDGQTMTPRNAINYLIEKFPWLN